MDVFSIFVYTDIYLYLYPKHKMYNIIIKQL
jgi:hypothetical protein